MSLHSRKIRLIMELRHSGVTDTATLAAMERIPREAFVPGAFRDRSYDPRTLPIGCGQTLSNPQVVALMTQALSPTRSSKVLEVGTGSGYQTAVLSRLSRRIYTIERHKGLLLEAEARFKSLRIHNITTRHGDGTAGWPEQAPFDRILLTAAAEKVPPKIAEQLALGGVLVLPMGPDREGQRLMRIERRLDGSWHADDLGLVRFVPLVAGALPPMEVVVVPESLAAVEEA
ncbi:MAG TPA: protein-L-isoaspartate(D-aspartate) O-methyltransferase [Alphaproteobacteria bacterium]|nr:protein-L-isoaspartate(D-aspartate) O-methyltransferase [Alphaproteobacteria bacterium]